MKAAIDRAFAVRRKVRLQRQLALVKRELEQSSAEGSMPQRAELERDAGILEEELVRLSEQASVAADDLDDDEDEYVELEAELREHEESLHIADNAFTFLTRALEQGADAAQHVHRAQRWLDRLRRELATSAVPPDPQLAGKDLAGIDQAFAARGVVALERARDTVDRARRNFRAATLRLRKQADLLKRRIAARKVESDSDE